MTADPGTPSAPLASVRELVQDVAVDQHTIETVPLAGIVAAYLLSLDSADTINLDEAGEFLQLAAGMMLLKSEHVLPRQAADAYNEEGVERQRPILIDRAGISAGAAFLRVRHGNESFVPLLHPSPIERPVEPRVPSLLSRCWEEMQKRSGKAVRRVAAPAFVRLEVAVSTIIRHLRSGRPVRLGRLLRGATRQDAVMHFLAVLELVRRRQATAEQPDLFADIMIERSQQAGEDVASRAG